MASGNVLDAIHNEMRNKKLLINQSLGNSDSDQDEINYRKEERKTRIPTAKQNLQLKSKMARNQSTEGSMTSGVHSACEMDSRSSTSPMDHLTAKNQPRTRTKVKRAEAKSAQPTGFSSTSGEEDEQLPEINLSDDELVFMTEQLSRLRTKEKKQKIAEARLTVTEAKLMEFAAKLAARKSKVEENHGRLKNRKNRIREKEEKIRELELEMNNLDEEVKRRSDVLREKEKTLVANETIVNEKEGDIQNREQQVSDQLKSIEQRQKIIERKENMIREMSQLLLNQEMTSTRELNFHTRRFNRHHEEGGRRHASDEEIYDTFQRSRSTADLTEHMSDMWAGAAAECHRAGSPRTSEKSSNENLNNAQAQSKANGKKNGLQRIFANMKKAKSMEKLHGGNEFIRRDIDCSLSAENSGGENKKNDQLKKKTKTKSQSDKKDNSVMEPVPEPPARNQSIEYKPAPLLHHPNMMQQLHQHHMNAHSHDQSINSMKFLPQIAQFSNPQFLLNQDNFQSAFQMQIDAQNQKSVSWQEESYHGNKSRRTPDTRSEKRQRPEQQKKIRFQQQSSTRCNHVHFPVAIQSK